MAIYSTPTIVSPHRSSLAPAGSHRASSFMPKMKKPLPERQATPVPALTTCERRRPKNNSMARHSLDFKMSSLTRDSRVNSNSSNSSCWLAFENDPDLAGQVQHSNLAVLDTLVRPAWLNTRNSLCAALSVAPEFRSTNNTVKLETSRLLPAVEEEDCSENMSSASALPGQVDDALLELGMMLDTCFPLQEYDNSDDEKWYSAGATAATTPRSPVSKSKADDALPSWARKTREALRVIDEDDEDEGKASETESEYDRKYRL